MSRDFLTLDVFTGRPFEGNPLAVFPDAAGLSGAQMQRIAAEFNLSETVFVLPPEGGGDARLRIFTPRRELPFAGHPTIGTALALSLLGRTRDRILLEEGVGIVPVTLEGGIATLTSPQAPRRSDTGIDREELAALIGVSVGEVVDSAVCDAGVAFTIIELRSPESVDDAALDPGQWQRVLAASAAPHVYVFGRVSGGDRDSEIYARMFAPAMGIDEDPATGAAAVALAAYLGAGKYRIRQGVKMGRPSELILDAGSDVRLGGQAVRVSSGRFHI